MCENWAVIWYKQLFYDIFKVSIFVSTVPTIVRNNGTPFLWKENAEARLRHTTGANILLPPENIPLLTCGIFAPVVCECPGPLNQLREIADGNFLYYRY